VGTLARCIPPKEEGERARWQRHHRQDPDRVCVRVNTMPVAERITVIFLSLRFSFPTPHQELYTIAWRRKIKPIQNELSMSTPLLLPERQVPGSRWQMPDSRDRETWRNSQPLRLKQVAPRRSFVDEAEKVLYSEAGLRKTKSTRRRASARPSRPPNRPKS